MAPNINCNQRNLTITVLATFSVILLVLGYHYRVHIVGNTAQTGIGIYNKPHTKWEDEQGKRANPKASDGDTWQNMLSFLHLDVMGQCENIFKLAPNKDYERTISPYFKMVDIHNRVINEIAAKGGRKFRECVTGYSAMFKEETFVMLSLARLPFIRTVCETGFNGGHSALLWLSADPVIQVYSFDMGEFPCAKPMADYLQNLYPGRLNVTWGDSTQTLPKFIKEHPNVKCDLMIIDGGHTYSVAQQDRLNFRKMVRGGDNIVFIDNYPDSHFVKYKLGRAWEEAMRHGDIIEYFRCNYAKYNQGFTFGRFLLDQGNK